MVQEEIPDHEELVVSQKIRLGLGSPEWFSFDGYDSAEQKDWQGFSFYAFLFGL